MADRKGSASLRSGNAVAGDGQPASTPTPPQPSATATVAASALFSTRSTSPYGTRSRNRGARVNYAEDKDNEMDYEYTESSAAGGAANTGSTTTTNTTANHTGNTAATAGATSTTTNSAKLAVQGIDGAAGSSSRRQSAAIIANGQKETVVATLAPTNVAAGKKRKGGSQAVTVLQPMVKDSSLSNMLSFENPVLQDGKLISDDGTVLSVHDHIYLICEPPGEPYYLARIMEFLHSKNDPAKPVDSIRVNWYYRPKDIQRKVTDTRVLFASMHSDTCPLTSIRGKCYIRHRDEIENLDAYRKDRDCFYFERMFDRYIHRYYDVVPTTKVKNVPEAIRKVLCERWKYLLVEPQRVKELCSQMKECKRCTSYCANNESVHCAVCGQSYHMNCVRPPLLKKPSRGFAWACGPCNQVQERKLEARHTPQLKAAGEAEEEAVDEDDEDGLPVEGARGGNGTETPSEAAVGILKQQEPTPDQVNFAHMWQMRYLGQHCRVEDALDYDDRIYPRAASRIGPRHQAIVPPWAGRPVEYVKPAEVKRKHSKNAKNQAAKDAEAKEKRPAWVMDEPPGYIERGGDDGTTSTLQFKIPVESSDRESAERGFGEKVEILDEYMESTKKIAGDLKMKFYATNFVDKAAELLFRNDWEPEKAREQLSKVNPVKDLKEPRLKPEEIKRFEEGVAKYGSELHLVAKHVKTRKESDIVRYYYGWKKTPRGIDIWGNYDGRREKKANKLKNKESVTKLVDDVADDEDDSAFDVEKAGNKKRGFECKFCATRHSRQWRRAPGVAPGTLISTEKPNSHKKKQEEKWLVSALCRRCGELWRRYAIQWEDPEEVQKKMGQGGGRAWKRRIDEELLKELTAAQEDAKAEAAALAAVTATSVTPQPTTSVSGSATPDLQLKEPPKKKHKGETNGVAKKSKEKDAKEKEKAAADKAAAAEKQKEKEKSKEPPPPPPEPPKPRRAPCGVCGETEEIGKKHAVCRDCKMTVHRRCYGVGEIRNVNKWVCEMCANDKNPIVSTNYECVLCPHVADPDAEPEKNNPYHKSSYKKKAAEQKAKDSPEIDGRKVKDADKHRPQQPREPLKKTAHNNWAHVICSVFTPEIKFSDPPTMRVVEGVGAIPQARWLQECKICHVGGGSNGACVQCPTCHCFVHVGCADEAGWTLGFDIQPVKGSRRDTVNIVKVGNETGNMIAGVWCKEHNHKTVHRMNEVLDESGLTALELYVNTYKQADLTLTGTVRKANQVSLSTKTTPSHRRNSLVGGTIKEGADTPATVFLKTDGPEDTVAGIEGLIRDHVGGEGSKKCLQCDVSTSPLWWKASGPGSGPNGAVPSLANGTPSSMPTTTTNGITRTLGLLCHRCHCTEQPHPKNLPKQQPPPPQTNGVQTNGEIPPPPPPQQQGKYIALPPLHLFLAEQHAILTKRQMAQAQAPVLPPVAPTPPPPMMTGPIPVAQQGPPMGQQLSHQPPSMPLQQQPVQQGHPQMHHNGHAPPPHGPPSHGPPQHPQHAVLPHHPHAAPLPPPHMPHVQHPHAPHSQIQHPQVQHNMHNVQHPNGPHSNGPHPNHRPLSHPAPPLAHNMSPRVPQMSPRAPYTNTSPRMSHMSPQMQGLPSPHTVPIHSPVRPSHPSHPSHHMAHQPPHGYHASPPPPYPMQRHLPQMAPTASMSVGQPGPSRQQEDDRRRMEEERRRRESEDRRREDERRNGRMSGASGSPALANLLS